MAYKAAGKCSECGAKLVDAEGNPRPAGTYTCCPAHRNKRSRRLKAARLKAGKQSKFAPEHQDLAAATRGDVKDAAHEVLKEELRPVIREVMTADVLAGIADLVNATPRAIELLKGQMESADETIAQRAVTLALKYTMGNPSVAPAPTHAAPAPMTVILGLPRAGDTTSESIEAGDAVELRECTDCGQSKTDAEFVGASKRCVVCFEGLKGKIAERLGGP